MKIECRMFRGEHLSPGVECTEPGAIQASRDECDINVIVSRYLKTGELPAARQGFYADLSALGSLQEALEVTMKAEAAFMGLPAHIRKEFDNDPVKLVAFAHDDRNYDRAVELGLIDGRVARTRKDAQGGGEDAPPPAAPHTRGKDGRKRQESTSAGPSGSAGDPAGGAEQ